MVVFKPGSGKDLFNHMTFSSLVFSQSHVNKCLLLSVILFLGFTQWGETEYPNIRSISAQCTWWQRHWSVALYCSLQGQVVTNRSAGPQLPSVGHSLCHVGTGRSAHRTIWSSQGAIRVVGSTSNWRIKTDLGAH